MSVYSYQEALEKSTEYFGGDELSAQIFVDKYAMRDEEDNLLEGTPDDMHRRIAHEIAKIEKKKFKKPLSEDEIFDLLQGFKKVVPQGSPMFGIGNPGYITLSNCYVVEPPIDSYGGIMYTDEQIVQISKRRGGTGTNLNSLRPNHSPTNNSSRTSSGVVSFANRYSNTIREVGQHGRRGALMLCLNAHHPEVAEFALCKTDKTKVTGANISIQITDSFMRNLDGSYIQHWPLDCPLEEAQVSLNVPTDMVWDKIVQNAWDNGEPGVLFWDTILRESVSDCYAHLGFETVATNPCSELPLPALDSCRLILVNAFTFVKRAFHGNAYFDYHDFFETTKMAQRIIDDIIDIEIQHINRIISKIKKDPEPDFIKERELLLWQKVKEKCMQGRRTGVGLTGLADVFAALNVPYGSDKSLELTDRIYKTLKFGCYQSSIDMAKELGSFPIFDFELEKDNPFLNRMYEEEIQLGDKVLKGSSLKRQMKKYGRRNIAALTSAPTGSASEQTQTSSAIEPVIFLVVTRRKKGNEGDKGFRSDFVDPNGDHWMEFGKRYHPKLKMWMEVTDNDNVEESPWYGSCSQDLDYIRRVELQATAQKHIDHSISSTINLPADVKPGVIDQIYRKAWELGCKGITVYREGSRTGVILDDKKVDKAEKAVIMKRPRKVPCDVHHITVKGQEYFVLVGLMDNKPYEVFAGKNGHIPKKIKTGTIIRKRKNFYKALFDDSDEELSPVTASCTELEEIITRLTSLSLRSGTDMHVVVQQLEKVGERQEINSFARSVARALKKYIPDGTKENELCPECSSDKTVRQEGCVMCKVCGWSRCL